MTPIDYVSCPTTSIISQPHNPPQILSVLVRTIKWKNVQLGNGRQLVDPGLRMSKPTLRELLIIKILSHKFSNQRKLDTNTQGDFGTIFLIYRVLTYFLNLEFP